MSGPVPIPILVVASAAAVACITFIALNLMRQYRLRRHLNRLRRMPIEQFGR